MLRDKPSHNERDLKVNVYVSGVCVYELWSNVEWAKKKKRTKNEKERLILVDCLWFGVLFCFVFFLLYFTFVVSFFFVIIKIDDDDDDQQITQQQQ